MDRSSKLSELIVYRILRNRLLPLFKCLLCIILWWWVFIINIKKVFFKVKGCCKRSKLRITSRRFDFSCVFRIEVFKPCFQSICKPFFSFDTIYTSHPFLNFTSYSIDRFICLHNNVEMVDRPSCIRHSIRYRLFKWAIHIRAYPLHFFPVSEAHEIFCQCFLIASLKDVV